MQMTLSLTFPVTSKAYQTPKLSKSPSNVGRILMSINFYDQKW